MNGKMVQLHWNTKHSLYVCHDGIQIVCAKPKYAKQEDNEQAQY